MVTWRNESGVGKNLERERGFNKLVENLRAKSTAVRYSQLRGIRIGVNGRAWTICEWNSHVVFTALNCL